MPKFYVQCGPIQAILLADSIDHAASCGLDCTLQQHLRIYDDPDLCEQDQHDHLMLEALMHLDPTVRVSERGFDRDDAALVGTPETVERWHHLMLGMSKLFASAGLAPRSMAQVACAVESRPVVRPRSPK